MTKAETDSAEAGERVAGARVRRLSVKCPPWASWPLWLPYITERITA